MCTTETRKPGDGTEGLVIDVAASQGERVFPEEECLWNRELQGTLARIQEWWRRLDGSGDPAGDGAGSPQLAVAVIGERGSGKSSFLRTLGHRIEQRAEDPRDPFQAVVLPLMDPTLLGPQDHFLYAVLGALLEVLEERVPTWRETEVAGKLEAVLRYLPSLNGRPVETDEPALLVLDHLDRHRGAPLLARKVHDFLGAAALHLATPARRVYPSPPLLILPVDDVDLAAHQLLPTLEALRRYLRHPLLVPVVAFSDAIARVVLWDAVRSRLQRPGEIPGDVEELVQGVVDHHLAKLFPVGPRIHLGSRLDFLLRARVKVRQSGGTRGEDYPLQDLLRAAAGVVLGTADTPERGFLQWLLPANTRMAMQALDTLSALEEGAGPGILHRLVAGLLHAATPELRRLFPEAGSSVLRDGERRPGGAGLRPLALDLETAHRLARRWAEAAWDRGLVLFYLLVLWWAGDTGGDSRHRLRGLGLHLAALEEFYLPVATAVSLGVASGDRVLVGRAGSDTLRQRLQARGEPAGLGMLRLRPQGEPRVPRGGFHREENGGAGRQEVPMRVYLPMAPDAVGELWEGLSCRAWLRELLRRRTPGGELPLPPFPGLRELIDLLPPRGRILAGIWTVADENHWSWAAVSMWRGLELLAGLLPLVREEGMARDEGVEAVRSRLESHLAAGGVLRAVTATTAAGPGERDVRAAVNRVAEGLVRWLEALRSTSAPASAMALVDPTVGGGEVLRSLDEFNEKDVPAHHSMGSALSFWSEIVLRIWARHLGSSGADDGARPAAEVLREFPAWAPFVAPEAEATLALWGVPLPGANVDWRGVFDAVATVETAGYYAPVLERFFSAEVPLEELV